MFLQTYDIETALARFTSISFFRSGEDEEEFQTLFAKVEKYEGITDNMEYEIAHYLQKVSEGRLSDDAKKQVQRMFLEVDDLESIGECL